MPKTADSLLAPGLGASVRGIAALEDARRLARRRLPRLVFDFIEGGAGDEVALAANRAALDAIKLQPRVLEDTSRRDLSAEFLGRRYDLPIGMAPMGMCALAHPEADRLMARLALEANIPLGLSTAASTSIEAMAPLAPQQLWFQLYVGQSQHNGLAMADRAAAAGYHTLVLTVDVPEVSRRARDLRNGFQVPFRIGPRQALDFALHPAWAVQRLMAGVPYQANFDRTKGGFRRDEPRAGADWAFLDRLRQRWEGALIVKGVTSPTDAMRIRDAGADAMWVSNHGGRQLDAVMPAIQILPHIRRAVGADLPLLFDSGVRTGGDVVRALALGADFVMMGRPWMYGLGAAGGRGLVSVARLLKGEISNVMAQIGARSIADLTPDVLAEAHLAKPVPGAPRAALSQVT
ncbi:MAG: alpha-hydroxy acid oxidase [Pseudomonadota bacterium]